MHARVKLPKAFSVRDKHEFFPIQHLMTRLSRKLVVRHIATGVHVNGGETVFWGLVYRKGKTPSKKKVKSALRKAGFDFDKNVLDKTVIAWANRPFVGDGKE